MRIAGRIPGTGLTLSGPAPAFGTHHVQGNVIELTVEDAIPACADGLHPRMTGPSSAMWNMTTPATVQIFEDQK
jgi:hypothetical protein